MCPLLLWLGLVGKNVYVRSSLNGTDVNLFRGDSLFVYHHRYSGDVEPEHAP